MNHIHVYNAALAANSSSTPLSGGESFTGPWAGRNSNNPVITVGMASDVAGTLYIDFSTDKENVDSSIAISFTPGNINPPQPYVVTRPYFRVRYVNGASAQSYFRMSVVDGNPPPLTSTLGSTVASTFPTIVTRSISERIPIALGRFEGYTQVNKFGDNPDIDTGTVPEDVVYTGGIYAGFPTGAAEQFVIVLSDAADIGGVVTFQYLADYTSTDWSTAVITTTGLTTNTGITGVRSTRGIINRGGAVNAGTVTLRHITTTANVFWQIPIAWGQTRVAVDTIPAGRYGLLENLRVQVGKSSGTSVVTGGLWVRGLGESPRIIRPFSLVKESDGADPIPGFLPLQGFMDLKVHVLNVTGNNTRVLANFDYYLVTA